MRFDARAERADGIETVCLRDTETGAACHLLPQLGGTVWRLSLTTAPGAVNHGRAPSGHSAAVLEADSPDELYANPWFRGRLLVPFNDRIPQGAYEFAGHTHRLAVNDPESGSAIHGLLYDQALAVEELTAEEEGATARLAFAVEPDAFAGYPFALRVVVTYRLTAQAFHLGIEILNGGEGPAPVTAGWHPYIAARSTATPPGSIAEATLTCPAGRYVEVDEELLPTGNRPGVTGGPIDFTSTRRIGARELDIALERSPPASPAAQRENPAPGAPAGSWCAAVVGRGEDTVTVEQSIPPFSFTQLFIPPSRTSIAVEPVTAATDAFNRPELGLRSLAAGETLSGWVRLRRGPPLQTGAGDSRAQASPVV